MRIIKWPFLIFGAALSPLILALIVSAAPAAHQPGPTVNVLVAYTDGKLVVDEFLPSEIRVAEGTTVTWTETGLREHHVMFLAGAPRPLRDIPQPEDPSLPRMRNPLVNYPTLPRGPYDGTYLINSGILEQGDTFSVTFARAGAYPFVCVLPGHDRMKGQVDVVPPGSPGITTQEEVESYIAAEVVRFQAQAEQIMAERGLPVRLDGADGGNTWFVRVGAEWRQEADLTVGRVTLRAYLPDRLTIRQSDTVVWYADTRINVHTVTFPPVGAPPPVRWVPRFEDGREVPMELLTHTGKYVGRADSFEWPRTLENTAVLRPSRPSAVYDPTQWFNSGQLNDGDPALGKAWSLTFQTPGSFTYFCIPHVEVGQIGQLTVLPRS